MLGYLLKNMCRNHKRSCQASFEIFSTVILFIGIATGGTRESDPPLMQFWPLF